MADDGRTYIRVHDGMPDHPKVDALSDKAFRLLVETWCWCSRHLTDGRVPRATWARRGTPAARRELTTAGLVLDHGTDGVEMHDYLQHQRSRAEVAEISENRRTASQKANHTRWHTGTKGKTDPTCPLCNTSGSDPEPDPEPDSVGGSVGVPIDRDIDRDTAQEPVVDRRSSAAVSKPRTGAAARRPREHVPAAELDATATSPAGYQLVAVWAEANPGLTSGKRRELGKAVDGLLAQGADPNLIPAALDAAHDRRFRNPAGALPHAYDDVRRAAQQATQPAVPSRVPTTTARVQGALALLRPDGDQP